MQLTSQRRHASVSVNGRPTTTSACWTTVRHTDIDAHSRQAIRLAGRLRGVLRLAVMHGQAKQATCGAEDRVGPGRYSFTVQAVLEPRFLPACL